MRGPASLLALTLLLGVALPAGAEEEPPEESSFVEDVTVEGRADELVGIADSATEGTVGQADLAQRPLLRPGEILEAVPGLIITQHSGSGKANQYYLRGFNLDHGTDFRTTVDGIQANLPTHGHGQGYTDLNFLIPELVAGERYRKGPYSVLDGDFSAAGAVDVELFRALPAPILEAVAGNFGYRRALAAGSIPAVQGDLIGGFEYLHSDGPWIQQDDFTKYSGMARYSRGDATTGFTITGMGYGGTWNSTDQVPARAVEVGSLSRFGTIDPTDGGEARRFSLTADIRKPAGGAQWRTRLYLLHSDLKLFSNFTYFMDDPVNGDQFEQSDRRFVSGFEVTSTFTSKAGGRTFLTLAGATLRRDDVENGLFHDVARVRLSTTRQDDIVQYGGGVFVETRVAWNQWFRMVAGLRGDLYLAKVDSDLAANSGRVDQLLASPKLSLVFGPWKQTETYVNVGLGFHSNDARGATITVDPSTGEPAGRVPPMARALGVDLGVRTQSGRRAQTTVSLFLLDLASELVFVGDAGVTEAGRPSRRAGIEWANALRPRPWLGLDLDFAYSYGRFTDDDPAGDRIPGAVEGIASAGLAIIDLHHVFASVWLRYFGQRPLIEDNSVRSHSSTLLNAEVGYEVARGVRLTLSGFNLLNTQASDVDYYYASRLPGESAPVEDVHFHPAESRSVRLALAFSP